MKHVPIIVVKNGKAKCINPPLHKTEKEATEDALFDLERQGKSVEELLKQDGSFVLGKQDTAPLKESMTQEEAVEQGAAPQAELYTSKEMELLKRAATDRYGVAMPSLLKVRDKTGQLVKMKPTTLHRNFVDTRKRTALVVKGRQVFFTTFVAADYYLDCVLRDGIRTMFINMNTDTTQEVFQRVKCFNEHFPVRKLLPEVERETTDKLVWKNGSTFVCATAKNDDSEENAKSLGRSLTQQRVHITEAGYLRHYRAFMNGLSDSIPREGVLTIESTANGAQGGFYEDVMEVYTSGTQVAPGVWWLGERSLHFLQWWLHYEYSMTEDVFSDPAIYNRLTTSIRTLISEDDQRQLEQMSTDTSLTSEFKRNALNWRHWMLVNKKGLFRAPAESIQTMEVEYPSTVISAFRTSGISFLSTSIIDQKREQARRFCRDKDLPLWGRMATESGNPRPFPGNDVAFYRAPYNRAKEKWANRYVIGADPSSGDPTGDPAVILVKDRALNAVVAVARGAFGPAKLADMLVDLALWYDNALLCFEMNNHGSAVQLRVWDRQYKNVFVGKPHFEDYRGYGFFTSKYSRRDGLALLQSNFEDDNGGLMVYEDQFYVEAIGFKIPVGSEKPEAASGCTDDLILAALNMEVACASLPPCRKLDSLTDTGRTMADIMGLPYEQAVQGMGNCI